MQSSDYDNTMSGTTGTTGNTGMGMNNAGMGSTTGTGMMGSAGTASGTGGGDMLDKGVDYMEKRGGHEQSHSTTEKISDGIRTGFKKMTGKDVPVKDKNYQ